MDKGYTEPIAAEPLLHNIPCIFECEIYIVRRHRGHVTALSHKAYG